jgi:hypothetical protein
MIALEVWPMSRDRDEFEGIDINVPWGGIRIGSGGFRGDEWDDDAELRQVRRRVRQRLDFLKNLAFFVLITGGLALLDWATGGGWWVQWLAIIWGAFLVMQGLSLFVAPVVWGREAEERMVQREMERRRGRVHVQDAPRSDRTDT